MSQLVPVQRCCDSHSDWPVLTRHLVAAFPEVTIPEIVSIVSRGRQAVDTFGLDDAEHRSTVETMARHELLQLTGQMKTNARLKPESHHRRGSSSSEPDPVGI
jgi:hypothetical protein